MGRSWWMRCIALIIISGFSILSLFPTVFNWDPSQSKFPLKQKINLGLDLQGGLYLVLGADFNQVFRDVTDRQASHLEQRLKEKKIDVKGVKAVRDGFPIDDPRIQVQFDEKKQDQVRQIIKDEYWNLRLTDAKPGDLQLGIAHEYKGEVREKTINQSIEVIRNRIDEFGVAEPSIQSQGTDRIVVELPGVKEVDRAKDLIGRTAKLEFKIANDKAMDPGKLAATIAEIEKTNGFTYKEGEKFSEYVKKLNELAKGKIPEDSFIAFERIKSMGVGEEPGTGRWLPYLLYNKTEVTGEDLQDAQIQIDPETRAPYVSFSLNPRGAASFERVTGEHIRERLAIVLDNIVHSAPVIQSKIGGGRGQITLGQGGDDVMKEAKDLAIVLRAGALPAQLEFQEQRVVGPSLGSDSVKKGAMASLIGIVAVFLFTAFYYRVSGVIAVVSLMLNVIFVLAIFVGLEATLTLPGIAGIALTVGIAVDSNVVIYERIREELRLGKSIQGSIEAGFQKAFRTIMDANITNAAAALILMNFGTGPIKGFAVTLMIGIVTTLFTAVFVCRLFFDSYLKILESKQAKTISI